jgi:hypothetical protein
MRQAINCGDPVGHDGPAASISISKDTAMQTAQLAAAIERDLFRADTKQHDDEKLKNMERFPKRLIARKERPFVRRHPLSFSLCLLTT